MDRQRAREEAERCLLCEDPPCRTGCPARVDPRVFIRKIRMEDLAGAARHLRRHNVLAGVCAEICASERQCAGACLGAKLARPIDIAGLQRFVCAWEQASGELDVVRVTPWREPVAVIGAGPAGLAAAAELAQRGFAVTVFDRATRAGGLLRSVLPEWRLATATLDWDVALVEGLGVEFRLGTDVPSPAALLNEAFAAVCVAAGTPRPVPLGVPGEEQARVHQALDLLRAAKARADLGLGAQVAVVGGGDVAIDAARTARRAGAEVTLLYRRSRDVMPASAAEVDAAAREGVEFLFHVVPLAIEAGEAPGTLSGVQLQRVRWEVPGRAARTATAVGQPFHLPCDDLIVAVGLRATESAGAVPPGVFIGGDAATGPRSAVEAIANGRAAAASIEAYLDARGGASRGSAVTGAPEIYRAPRADLVVTFCGVRFENPFVLAAAPSTDDLAMLRDTLQAGWAGAVLKTTSVAGTPVPLAYPMIAGVEGEGRRVIGLGNIDLISEHAIDEIERRIRALKAEFPGKVVIASIMGATRADWESLARRASAAGADMIECSFSCPQGTLGDETRVARPGSMLGQDPERVRRVTGWVKGAAGTAPVVIKITPQVADIAEIARAVADGGADAICAANTIPSLAGIDLATDAPQPDVGGRSSFAGLSGPALRPITLRTIAEIARATRLPVTATGGPTTWRDAAQCLLVGATTVQFCTAVMRYGRDIIEDLCEGLAHDLDRRGLRSPAALIGRALPQIVAHEALSRETRVRARIDLARCIGDGACFIACRDGGHRAIAFGVEREPRVDDERCVGCGLCAVVCPVEACIRMEAKGR